MGRRRRTGVFRARTRRRWRPQCPRRDEVSWSPAFASGLEGSWLASRGETDRGGKIPGGKKRKKKRVQEGESKDRVRLTQRAHGRVLDGHFAVATREPVVNNRALDFRPASLSAVSPLSGATCRHRQALAMPVNRPGHRIRLHPAPGARHDSTAPAVADTVHYEALFVSNLHVVDATIHYICQRHKLFGTEAQEFESEVKLRLVEREYDIFRKFQHRSSLRTYLTIVIQRIYLDYRNHLWGKWRPSAEAQRLGPIAVRLELLIARDGFSFDQACEHLRTNEHIVAEDSELEAIVVRLPVRSRPAIAPEEELDEVADGTAPLDERLFSDERCARAQRISDALTSAMRSLSDQDRVMLRLRFQDGFAVADIARALHLEQKPLYRRFEALLRGLRAALEGAGIDRAEASELLNRNDVDIRLALLGGPDSAAAAGPASAQDRSS